MPVEFYSNGATFTAASTAGTSWLNFGSGNSANNYNQLYVDKNGVYKAQLNNMPKMNWPQAEEDDEPALWEQI